MSIVEFLYNNNPIIVQCNSNEKMKDIIQKFYTKSGCNPNSTYFIYSGSTISNRDLTFSQTINSMDRQRNRMKILVIESNNNRRDINYNLINNSGNPQSFGRPLIFNTMDNLNKRFENLENELKQQSANMRRRIERMQDQLMTINKKKIRYSDATYYGETIGDEVTGLGIIENDNGLRYEGQMLDSDRSGIGIFYDKDGVIFMGEYKKNKRNGFGIEENPKVGKYEGSWLDDSLTGTGILSFKDGRIYIGQMDKANFSGSGKLLFPDGSYYIGEFKDGSRVKGKTFYADENGIFDSTWENNDKTTISRGTFYTYDGRVQKRTRIIDGPEGRWEYN